MRHWRLLNDAIIEGSVLTVLTLYTKGMEVRSIAARMCISQKQAKDLLRLAVRELHMRLPTNPDEEFRAEVKRALHERLSRDPIFQ